MDYKNFRQCPSINGIFRPMPAFPLFALLGVDGLRLRLRNRCGLGLNRNAPFLDGHYNLWFFSDLVVASLKDFQGKVAQIMKAVGLALDDFDFVVHPFQLAGVDGVVTVV